jgi:hypothetical protein
MSVTAVRRDASSGAKENDVDLKLEVVVIRGDSRPLPIEVLRDSIQPFRTYSEIYVEALKALRAEIATARQPVNVGAR